MGDLPGDVRGMSRIWRDGKVGLFKVPLNIVCFFDKSCVQVLWEKEFVSGEDNMSHWIANLEGHHFKYRQFNKPGDLHVHYFGTATLSFTDDIRTQVGDTFEIEAAPFVAPLKNSIEVDDYVAPSLQTIYEPVQITAVAKL